MNSSSLSLELIISLNKDVFIAMIGCCFLVFFLRFALFDCGFPLLFSSHFNLFEVLSRLEWWKIAKYSSDEHQGDESEMAEKRLTIVHCLRNATLHPYKEKFIELILQIEHLLFLTFISFDLFLLSASSFLSSLVLQFLLCLSEEFFY